MEIVINRRDGTEFVRGDYPSLKACVEAHKDHLEGASLRWTNLSEANLYGAKLSGANLSEANLCRSNLSRSNLCWADLSGTKLSRSNLSEAYLIRSNLSGANLSEANLAEIHGYRDSHALFAEAVCRQNPSSFSELEWAAIGQIITHSLCWDTIKQCWPSRMGHTFDVLAEAGFVEWRDHWLQILDKKEKE